MVTRLIRSQRLLLTVALSAVLVAPSFAQQPTDQTAQPGGAPSTAAPGAPKPTPPVQPEPTTVPGRPDIPNAEVAQKLKNVAPLPFGAPADKLPVAELKLPKGFKAEVYASGIPNARSLRIGDKGTVFVSNRVLDKVYAVVERNGKREAKVIAAGLDRPNGLAFHQGTLYIAEGTRISKLEKIEDNLDSPPKPVVIYSDFLNHQSHGWKFMALGPDNMLYVNVGSPCNICEPPATNGQLRRISLDGGRAEVYVRGVRNSVGFDWNPATKELYFTDNGRDWLSEDLPEDELNRVTKMGQHFGFPYCHQGNFTDRELGWGRSCDEFEKPVALLGPHAAALGMRFYMGKMFPAEYQNAIFIARHGSWNRTKKIGGDVVVAKLNKDGSVKSVEPFLTGFLKNNEFSGRPVDVQVMKDGSLLVSDDHAGAVYRVSYDNSKAPGN
ncbi:MAG TPA: PQQ-dependent sugar dehydrogenase [Verrucomicrobiae bacterium]|jgi:glucose/arabinose dehydrogenase|nr:PQQ-dependent sugar dehydrogenase [Verrucomicrobiae bacterium]